MSRIIENNDQKYLNGFRSQPVAQSCSNQKTRDACQIGSWELVHP